MSRSGLVHCGSSNQHHLGARAQRRPAGSRAADVSTAKRIDEVTVAGLAARCAWGRPRTGRAQRAKMDERVQLEVTGWPRMSMGLASPVLFPVPARGVVKKERENEIGRAHV